MHNLHQVAHEWNNSAFEEKKNFIFFSYCIAAGNILEEALLFVWEQRMHASSQKTACKFSHKINRLKIHCLLIYFLILVTYKILIESSNWSTIYCTPVFYPHGIFIQGRLVCDCCFSWYPKFHWGFLDGHAQGVYVNAWKMALNKDA